MGLPTLCNVNAELIYCGDGSFRNAERLHLGDLAKPLYHSQMEEIGVEIERQSAYSN